jgi:hypothetical protein
MGILDDLNPIGSLFGGGGSSASVSSSVEIKGLDKIGITETIEVKPIELKPVTFNENIDLKPIELKPVTLNENIDLKPIELKPVTLNENIDLQPVTLNENIDLKPVAVDTCQTLRLAPLPDTSVCNPYRHRIAMSLLGFEVLTLALTGETEQQIRSPRPTQRTERTRREYSRPSAPQGVVGRPQGISVRVIDADE